MKKIKNILVYFLATLVFVASNGFALKQCLCLCNICDESHPKLVLFEIDNHDHESDYICMESHCSGCSDCSNKESDKIATQTNFSFFKLKTLFLTNNTVELDKLHCDFDTHFDFLSIVVDKSNILAYDHIIHNKFLKEFSFALAEEMPIFLKHSSLRL